jgi:hypothetical protein
MSEISDTKHFEIVVITLVASVIDTELVATMEFCGLVLINPLIFVHQIQDFLHFSLSRWCHCIPSVLSR